MYEIECLTDENIEQDIQALSCSPFCGGCYPEVEGCCGPDCNPSY